VLGPPIYDGELARLGLPPERPGAGGIFPKAPCCPLHLGLRRKVAAIVGFSGLLAGAPPAGDMPPVLPRPWRQR